MLTKKDRLYAGKRKKMWDYFGWNYRGISFLSKTHSLNCGCGTCKMNTIVRNEENRKQRRNMKSELRREVESL